MKRASISRGKQVAISKKIGGLVEMKFDRELFRRGIRWLRVKDGMCGRGDREDWVADVEGLTVSVHDYQWKPPYFGLTTYKSIREAMDDQMKRGISSLEEEIINAENKAALARSVIINVRKLFLTKRRTSP